MMNLTYKNFNDLIDKLQRIGVLVDYYAHVDFDGWVYCSKSALKFNCPAKIEKNKNDSNLFIFSKTGITYKIFFFHDAPRIVENIEELWTMKLMV